MIARRYLPSLAMVIATTLPSCESDSGPETETVADTEGPESASDSSPDATTGTEPSVPSATGSPTTGTTPTSDPTSVAETGSGESSDTGAADCTDQLILDLSLVEGKVSDGAVLDAADGDGWTSTIDASAGGLPNAPTNPWVYLEFTDSGLRKVEIDDLEALSSDAWHIAAKRFGIRLNSGTSGPGEVVAASLDGMAYEDVTELPDSTLLLEESFYTADCQLLDDGSGLGAPAYLMTPWWTYPGCVATTGTPFLIELADGTQVKLIVDAYYGSGQAACNDTGAMGSDSANFTWRWSILP